jgi:hypothetical protein
VSNIWVDRTDTSNSLAHQGRGTVAYSVEIPGIGIYQSYSYTPTDAWFTTGWNSETGYLFDYLEWDISRVNERASWLEADLKVSPITIKIADLAGGMTSQLKSWKTRANTKLSVSATSTATAFSTLDNSDFTAGADLLWIGQECCRYSSSVTSGFANLTRGYLNTLQQPYTVYDTDQPPTRPLITDGPNGLYRRSVYVHAAVIDQQTGKPGASTIIYRGRVKKGVKIGKGKLELSIEHKVTVLADKVGQDMPSVKIVRLGRAAGDSGGPNVKEQYWYSGNALADSSYASGSHVEILSYQAAAGQDHFDVVPDEGHYFGGYSSSSLAYAWNVKAIEAGSAVGALSIPSVYPSGGKFRLSADAAGSQLLVRVHVHKFDPLWALGFDEGAYDSGVNEALDFEAQSAPRYLVYELSGISGTLPTMDVEDSSHLTAGARAQIPGNYAFKIESISVTALGRHTLTINPEDGDYWGHHHFNHHQLVYHAEEEEDATLRHCIVLGKFGALFSETDITNALRILLGVYRESTGVDEPREWFPQDVRREDFDWDELDLAVSSVPAVLRVWTDCITKGVQVWKVLGGWFGLFGICPRLTDDGKIGFERQAGLLALEAETVACDDEVWDGLNAAQVMGRMADGPLVNQVQVKHSYDYRFEDGEPDRAITTGAPHEWGIPIKIKNASGLAELGGIKSVSYELRGWFPGWSGVYLLESAQLIKDQVRATHFSLYGNESGVTTIPATWIAKQFRVGDVVNLTHELVPDTADGAIGVSSKPVKIEGRVGQLTNNRPDELTVRYGPTLFTAGIAPCALGDSYDVPTATMTCGDADTPLYEQSGNNDLDRFVSSSPMNVFLVDYNTVSPLAYSNATIKANGVDTTAKTVEFTSDPFSGSFPASGVWMSFADWDDASTYQQTGWAYSADLGSPPSLGTNNDTAKEWDI